MKKFGKTTFFLFLFFNMNYAQSPLVKQWDFRYGGSNNDIVSDFVVTPDHGYMIAGYSASNANGDKTVSSWGRSDYWIVKTDSGGVKEWDKGFGGLENDLLTSIQQTTDKGYILGGYSNSGISGYKTIASRGVHDFWMIKTDSLGNFSWDKAFGGSLEDQLVAIHQTSDNGYILGGTSNSGISGDKTQPNWNGLLTDFWIVKTDSLGNKQWDKDIGGTGMELLESIEPTKDGGYILAGTSNSGMNGNKSEASRGDFDYWIVKIDSSGTILWDKTFGGSQGDMLGAMQQTSDGGYILAGISNSGISGDKTHVSMGLQDYWVVKTDSMGVKEWDRGCGGTGAEVLCNMVNQTSDGGYLIGGTSESNIGGDKTEDNLGSMQSWIVKINFGGIKQWDKTLRTSSVQSAEICHGVQLNDGYYTFANFTDAGVGGDKTQSSRGLKDYWLIKFRDTSCIASNNFSVASQICRGQNYILPDGSSVNTTGTYSTTVVNSRGCDSIITTNLIVNEVHTSIVNPQICRGQNYILPDGSSVNATGTYSTTVVNSNGCDSIITTNLIVNEVQTSIVNTQICRGQNYILPDGSSVNATGTYSTTAVNSNGCDSIITTNLIVNEVQSSIVNTQICDGEHYTLPDGTTITTGGTYHSAFNSSSGCDSLVTVILAVHPSPSVSFLPSPIFGCTPVQVNFQNHSQAPAGSVSIWDLGDGTHSTDQAPSHLYTHSGSYLVSLTILTLQGCLGYLIVPDAVKAFAPPVADFSQSAEQVSLINPEVSFADLSYDAVSWNWNFGDGSAISHDRNPFHRFDETGNFTIELTVRNDVGCADTAYRKIKVENEQALYIPNSFTPNNDQVNEAFIAKGIGFKNFDMVILDRWGLEVFHSTDINEPWDGTNKKNGIDCKEGVYEYIVTVSDYSDKEHQYVGHVTLIR